MPATPFRHIAKRIAGMARSYKTIPHSPLLAPQ